MRNNDHMETHTAPYLSETTDTAAATECAAHAVVRDIVPFCPAFHRAMELIGRRWTGVIVRAMLAGVSQFSQLRVAIPGLSDRMLSERLKELEAAGIVTRTVIPDTPVRVVYALTDKGRALNDVLLVVSQWAETWPDAALHEAATDHAAYASDAAE